MEAAPGKTFFDIARGKPVCPDALTAKELNFPETCRFLRSNGKLDAMRANLMRELSKMEWADVLSGQVDRHGDNYLIDINPQTGAVKITGIDNDASFGTRKAGMTVVDLSRPTPRQQDFLSKLRREGYTIPPDGRIDLSKLPDRLLSETRQQFGFNQLFRPVFIDRDTFDKLTAHREDDYRAMLAPAWTTKPWMPRYPGSRTLSATPPGSKGSTASWRTGPPRASRKRMPGIRSAQRVHSGSASRTVSSPGTF